MTRLGTGLFFLVFTTYTVSALFPDPTVPVWVKIAYPVGAFLPLAFAMLAGPCVTSMRIHLPELARRGKEDLMKWVKSGVPPETILECNHIRFRPWVSTQHMKFGDLRRLPPSWKRMSNLEHIPQANRPGMRAAPLAGWFARRFMGRYYVDMVGVQGKLSNAPGAWDEVWQQIPMARDDKVEEQVGQRLSDSEKRRRLREVVVGERERAVLPPPTQKQVVRPPVRVGAKGMKRK
jgi:hypothetical protein